MPPLPSWSSAGSAGRGWRKRRRVLCRDIYFTSMKWDILLASLPATQLGGYFGTMHELGKPLEASEVSDSVHPVSSADF